MKIIITGEPGVGKTTLIKKLVKALGSRATGFWTEEVRDIKTKKRIGFKVVSTNGESTLFASKTFTSKHIVGSYGVNVERFERIALPVLEKALKEREKVIIIDEIGKMEFFSKAFVKLVEKLMFDQRYNVVATIPIRDFHPLIKEIRRIPGAVYLEITKENRDNIVEDILGLIQGF